MPYLSLPRNLPRNVFACFAPGARKVPRKACSWGERGAQVRKVKYCIVQCLHKVSFIYVLFATPRSVKCCRGLKSRKVRARLIREQP